MKFALQADQRIEATPKALGACPCCGTEMIAKCGNRKVWHWAHKTKQTCDHWWESETQWHRDWKNRFPVEWQEVIHKADDGEKHIADVKTPYGLVIEFQHSAISPDEILSRTNFYERIIWIVDGRRLKNDFERFDSRPHLFPWRKFNYPKFTQVNLPNNAFPSYKRWGFLKTPVLFDWGAVKSEYWTSDWDALVGLCSRGWFTVEKAELLNLLRDRESFFDELITPF
jgi:competence protein CoiA